MNDKKPWWRKDKDRPDLEDALGGWCLVLLVLGMFVVVMTVDDAQFFIPNVGFYYLWLFMLLASFIKFGMLLEKRYGPRHDKEG